MNILIQTTSSDAHQRILRASIGNPDISVTGLKIYFKSKHVADYSLVPEGIEIHVIDRPWYIPEALIESRIRAFFS